MMTMTGNDFRLYAGVDFSREFLCHYGVGHDQGGHSGRYPWGSGNRPHQRDVDKDKIIEAIKKIKGIPSRAQNYERNKFMPKKVLPKSPKMAKRWGWDNGVASVCHQFTSKDKSNSKWVSKDGRLEAIFDKYGKLVTDPSDYGTFNFADPNHDPLGHFMKDVLPWLAYGNSPEDSTTVAQRFNAFFVNGTFSIGKKVFRIN